MNTKDEFYESFSTFDFPGTKLGVWISLDIYETAVLNKKVHVIIILGEFIAHPKKFQVIKKVYI